MKFVLVGLYCGPLLTLKSSLARTYAKKHGIGNGVSGFRVSGGPPVIAKQRREREGEEEKFTY